MYTKEEFKQEAIRILEMVIEKIKDESYSVVELEINRELDDRFNEKRDS